MAPSTANVVADSIIASKDGFWNMKLPALSRDQVRQVDKIAIEQYGVPGIVLMENAGRGAAAMIDQIAKPGRIVILCGSGNNAGDGYVIARHLQLAGRQVRVVSIVDLESLSGDAKTNAMIVQKSGIEIRVATRAAEISESIGDAATIVDGLLGTGAARTAAGTVCRRGQCCQRYGGHAHRP